MRTFFRGLRNLVISGFFFLLPLIVVFILLAKAWASLTSVGKRIAGTFGIQTIAGVGGTSAFTGLLLIAICIACGLLMRYSLIAGFGKAMERTLSAYVPAYDSYKRLAEEKLQRKVTRLPYASALLKRQNCWQPAYVVEQDATGWYILFVPGAPDTTTGQVLLARQDDVRILAALKTNALDAALKKRGKGLLTDGLPLG